jgi:hypothetical protein
MKVICIRLASGEEIIGRLVEKTNLLLGNDSAPGQFDGTGPWECTGSVTLEKVRGIGAQQISKNEMAIAFSFWSLGNQDGKFLLNLDNCVAVYPAEIVLEQGYVEQTSSIQIARGNTPGIQM